MFSLGSIYKRKFFLMKDKHKLKSHIEEELDIESDLEVHIDYLKMQSYQCACGYDHCLNCEKYDGDEIVNVDEMLENFSKNSKDPYWDSKRKLSNNLNE